MTEESSIDVLIVGAGFSGLNLLHKFRKLGFQTKIYEAGSDIGGTWYWNRYPGARVDSDFPFYQLSTDDIWKEFEWTERFPGQPEIEKYFKHVDNKLNLSKDIKFSTRVTSAEFNNSRNQWFVKTNNGENRTWAHFLILCTGFADRRYTPPFKGLENFKGTSLHTSFWPKSGLNVAGKRVAVIGTGASGVQVIQEIGSQVGHLTVYQRTPNLALPMQQSSLKDQTKWQFPSTEKVKQILDARHTTFAGMDCDFFERNGVDDTPEERRALFEKLYEKGGFHFWIGNYKDILYSQELNDAAYQFWCESTRARINDPAKKDILAPIIPPHPFGDGKLSIPKATTLKLFEAASRSPFVIPPVKNDNKMESLLLSKSKKVLSPTIVASRFPKVATQNLSEIQPPSQESVKDTSLTEPWMKPFPIDDEGYVPVIVQYAISGYTKSAWVTLHKHKGANIHLLRTINKDIFFTPIVKMNEIKINALFRVPFEGIYYRGIVLEPICHALATVLVRLIDRGIEIDIPIDELKSAISVMKNLNAFAFQILFQTLRKVEIGETLKIRLKSMKDNKAVVTVEGEPEIVTMNDIEFVPISVGSKRNLYCLDYSNIIKGYIACCDNDKEAFVSMKEIDDKITTFCEISKGSYQPQIDELCLAQFLDSKWYRAVAVEVTGEHTFSVMLIDYGNTTNVHSSSVRKMPKEFLHPCLMSKCYIKGFPKRPSNNYIYSIAKFFMENQALHAKTVAFEEDKYVIDLT